MIRFRALLAVLVVATACGASDDGGAATSAVGVATIPTTPAATAPPLEGCAHVIEADAVAAGDGTYLFRVTVRSADTGPEKYADFWEIRDRDGAVLGERVLLHDHASEQPFTRTLGGVQIPEGVDEVVIAAHDSVAGFCGEEFVLQLG